MPVEARFFAPVQTGPGAHPASCTMGTGSFLGVKSCRCVTLTPHPFLVPWSRKGGAIPLLPLWAVRPVQSLSACTRVHFTFTFITDMLCVRHVMLITLVVFLKHIIWMIFLFVVKRTVPWRKPSVANVLPRRYGFVLTAEHVGFVAGKVALRQGFCDYFGFRLLSYNSSAASCTSFHLSLTLYNLRSWQRR
jgi:hypothetical protein